jgi:hypothetical protein
VTQCGTLCIAMRQAGMCIDRELTALLTRGA